MAGIGFELRRLFREQGLINNVRAYAYSSLATVGPMILCMVLIFALQRMMTAYDSGYADWELYIATVSYCFIFSIVLTSGMSIVITRYVADMLFEKKYDRLMSSFYGSLIVMLPIGSIAAVWFLSGVTAELDYKVAAYFFFMELIVIWLQGVYLSALKDYIRIARGFIFGGICALLGGWLLFQFTELQGTTAALFGLDIGFFVIAVLSFYHFEQKFPKGGSEYYFDFLKYFRKYGSLFFAGCFVYSGVYLHNFVYWWGPQGSEVADRFRVMPFYDLPVFYAFLSVMPTLVTFVVSVETSFYEKFRLYYLQILNGGTLADIAAAKKKMQKTLVREISFLMEIQLLFTVLAVALGIKFLPKIGFTMAQLDLFNILALGYFLFIVMFVLIHILMYFDDRKGVLWIGALFVALNLVCSYLMMHWTYDGLGMFIASFIALGVTIGRVLYVLRNIDYYTFCSQPVNQTKRSREKSMFAKPGISISVLLIAILLLSGCTDAATGEGPSGPEAAGETVFLPPITSDKLTEDKRIYERDQDDSLKTLYITVLPDKPNAADPIDWYGLNRIPDKGKDTKLNIIVQEGELNGGGPKSGMFGYGTDQANATITLRGNTAWYAPQKSYRIKLNDEAGLWEGQRTLNLNKHVLDLSRVRNKLSFDLFESIPDMTSLRTQFVHLYVKDLSAGAGDEGYVDYGLYTHVEQPNKRFLESHMLDRNGHLYKVAFFEFFRYEEQIKEHDDPGYDKELFETILEIKGREEHGKLIQMLEDVNDYTLSIEDVVTNHFDLDNFLTWTAANILMDNMDTDANNFYLYSPLNSNKWYFLPWDYDGGWELQRNKESIQLWQNGLSNYWGSVLHNRYFRNPEHVEQLKAKVEEISAYINRDTVSKLVDSYRPVVEPFLFRDPDIRYLPGLNTDFEKELQILKDTPERAIERFLEDLERPKPFYQHDVVQEGGKTVFSWDISYDIQGDDLFYDVAIASDPLFTQVMASATDLKETRLEIDALKPGVYYWKVSVRDSEGHAQTSFDYYLDEEGDYHFGMREFEVR